MMELTIKDQVYEFNFGIGFLYAVNKTAQQTIPNAPGVKKNVGLQFAVASILDNDVEALVDVLDLANKGKTPRVTKALLGEYIDQEDVNIDELFETVLDFLSKSNATKKITLELMKAAEQAKEE